MRVPDRIPGPWVAPKVGFEPDEILFEDALEHASGLIQIIRQPWQMDKAEARALLQDRLASFRRRSYDDLVALMGDVQIAEVVGESGVEYQIEIEVRWDSPREKLNVRVTGGIDDGRLPGALFPLCADFILAPNGTFIGE